MAQLESQTFDGSANQTSRRASFRSDKVVARCLELSMFSRRPRHRGKGEALLRYGRTHLFSRRRVSGWAFASVFASSTFRIADHPGDVFHPLR